MRRLPASPRPDDWAGAAAFPRSSNLGPRTVDSGGAGMAAIGHMGKTSYHLAMDAVIDHYLDSGATAPALVVFQTDGGPVSRPAAERHLCKAARLPLFWQFVGFGDPHGRQFDFLRRLDDLAVPGRRVVDNAGFFHAGEDPGKMPDGELYDRLVGEFPRWLTAARAAGITGTA
ncbi:VWA domain-containing protein [Streptomyces sp. NPDC101237]|uniref:VWA domain-containing protein n=1 Tax=Streptomyces sp. NPDC101237 TaxID=3366139 RepID=UPI003823CF0C